MIISNVVNGHLMVFAKMLPTLGTCLFPARNPVEYVAVVGMDLRQQKHPHLLPDLQVKLSPHFQVIYPNIYIITILCSVNISNIGDWQIELQMDD